MFIKGIINTELFRYFVTIVLIGFMIKFWDYKRKQWLSFTVKKELSKLRKTTFKQEISAYKEPIKEKASHLLNSKLSVVLIVILVYIVQKFQYNFLKLPSGTDKLLISMWQVQASVLAITVVIVTLIIQLHESRNSGHSKDSIDERISILFFRESHILPIVYFGLISLLSIGWTLLSQDISSKFNANAIFFVLNILLIIWLYSKTFEFIKPHYIENLRIEILNNAISNNLDIELKHRVSQNLMIKKLGEEEIKYEPFILNKHTGVPVTIPTLRTITDVNLQKLVKLKERLGDKGNKISVTKLIYGHASETDTVVGYLPDGASNNDVAKFKSAFKLKVLGKTKEITEYDELREALAGVKDECIKAIHAKSEIKTERILDTYHKTIKTYLECLKEYDLPGYDSEITRAISRDFYDIMEPGIKTKDKAIIRTVMRFPRRILEQAIVHEDINLFKQFTHLYPYSYHLSSNISRGGAHEFLLNRSWKHLDELSLGVQDKIEKAESKEEMASWFAFAENFLITFNSLLKRSMDTKDEVSFKKYKEVLEHLFEFLKVDYNGITSLELQLRSFKGSPEEKSELERKLTVEKERIIVSTEIAKDKEEALFGICGWLIKLYRADKITQPEFANFYEIASSHFKKLKDLSLVFTRLEMPIGNKFGWDWWDSEGKSDFKAHFLGVDTWLHWNYCILGIKLTPQKIGKTTPVEPSRELVHLLDETKTICNEVKNNKKKWEGIFTEGDFKKIPNFIKLNEIAVEKQIENEENQLIKQKLSKEKIEEFKKSVRKIWGEKAVVRKVIKKHGTLINKTSTKAPPEIGILGINKLSDKGALIEEWYVSYPQWADHYAKDIGEGENNHIIEKICNSINQKKKINLKDAELEVSNSITELEKVGYHPHMIVTGNWDILTKLEKSKDFIPSWAQNFPKEEIVGIEGIFKGIPVLRINGAGDRICICDIKKLGSLTQYVEGSKEIIDIKIDRIDKEYAERLIQKQPNLKKDTGGKIREEKVVVRELMQKVHLQIQEKFNLLIEDKKAGIVINISN